MGENVQETWESTMVVCTVEATVFRSINEQIDKIEWYTAGQLRILEKEKL